MANPAAPALSSDLQGRIATCATSRGATVREPAANTVEGTLTAIAAQWLLGGRKVTNSFRCVLDQDAHVVHFREAAAESCWGVPPPSFTVEATSQFGSRVRQSRTDKAAGGGGGRLEFGRFCEDVEKLVSESGWRFVHEVA
jgi:hypothetical protein